MEYYVVMEIECGCYLGIMSRISLNIKAHLSMTVVCSPTKFNADCLSKFSFYLILFIDRHDTMKPGQTPPFMLHQRLAEVISGER